MNIHNCKTCIHWKDRGEDYFVGSDIISPPHPVEFRKMTKEEEHKLFGFEVRYCTSPKRLFYERPERSGCAVVDGSQYDAALITAEEYGCVNHEPCE